ncbi:glutamate-cysteine ligase family protein [Natrialbaceae archaeon GCM10025810]|uniref:glutamate-cysteine ligase family protein n=1 Tax=Halovalidus salilacus TaxID=3075124 RepID=UPI00360F1125
MNTSLEVEYWVVTDDGDLAPPNELLDLADWVDPEFVEPMIEIKTDPCPSMADLREQLAARIDRAVDAAREEGKRLVPLATPLDAAPSDLPYREKRSTDLQRRIVGPTFDDARFCAGTHVHFEQSSVVDQLNALTALDPAFALVSSSAYHRSERLFECARPYLYRRCCYAPAPDQGQLWPYVDDVDEWEARLDRAYDRFRDRALERGVDASTFDDQFGPYDAVWSPVRLREKFPTVEWRSPDAALPSQVLDLTERVREIVVRADEFGTTVKANGWATDVGARPGTGNGRGSGPASTARPVTLPEFETVERIVDVAMRDGVDNHRVCHYLRGMDVDPTAFDPLAGAVTEPRLSSDRARTLRLRAADRLEADLERTRVRA